jgi:hypothetical protein
MTKNRFGQGCVILAIGERSGSFLRHAFDFLIEIPRADRQGTGEKISIFED